MPRVTQPGKLILKLSHSGPLTRRACPMDSLLLECPNDILPRARTKEGWSRDSRLEPPGTHKAPVGLPGPDMFCLFHGKRYSPGESWHPYLEPQGLMYCLRCTCSEVGSSGLL